MCLTILEKTNKRVAVNDILVYKCLDYDSDSYSTPFQYFPIYFTENGRYWMSVKNFTYSHEGNYKNVEQGIHAYYDKEMADDTSESFVDSCGTETHYAIIPKGAKYYIGNKGDVVTTTLIIFETEKDYENYIVEKNGEKICKIGKNSLSLQEI